MVNPTEPGPGARSWADRVAFSSEGFAYRPSEVCVPVEEVGRAMEMIPVLARPSDATVSGYARLRGPVDPLSTTSALRAAGMRAQPNHVLFADCGQCCCPPHPAAGLAGNPMYGNPMYGNPMYGNPMYGNPMYGNAMYGNPMYGNPMYGNPMYGNPASPAAPSEYQTTGRRRSSARPNDDPGLPPPSSHRGDPAPTVAVVDTGLAATAFRPAGLRATALSAPDGAASDDGVPDFDSDGFLDPASGHSTFIAGLIEQIAPSAAVTVTRVLTNLGDGDEWQIGQAVEQLAGQADIVNLSLGGYAADRMEMLGGAISLVQRTPCPAAGSATNTDAELQGSVVVASAGNDATCRAPYPACLPGVVSVGAIGPAGPARFTNYGPWVRACAPGVDLVSSFYVDFDGGETATGSDRDPDAFAGWARWSGTSFAAPVVAGALAREMERSGCLPREAVARIVDAPGLGRIPQLGTVVNVL